MGNPLENSIASVTVNVLDQSIEGTNLNLALILTNETPIVTITGRTKEYFSAAEVATDWANTSKVHKAASRHFSQQPHNDRIKIGIQVAKGAVLDDKAISVASEIATVTSVAHGLSIGQEITTLDSEPGSSLSPLLEGVKEILTTPTADTFTFAAPGVPDIGPGTIDYHEGDADITSALDAIYSMDTNFFQVFSIYRSKTDIKEIAAWIEGKNLKYTFSTESADVKNLISTNVFAELAALNYSQTSGHWIHDAGVDAAGVAITVADEVATVTRAAHGLRVEDSLTVSGATPAGLNGNKTVASVIDVDNFTYGATGVIDGAATGTINYFARYSFHEVAVEALMFGEDEGTETGLGTASWANKQITGSTATPDSILTSARALQIVELYNGNVYKELKGFAQTIGGKSFSGRTIKVQTVADWIEVRLQESSLQLLIAVKQLLYTNSDIAKINNAWSEPLNTQLTRGGITPLDDIRPYSIVLPRSNAVPAADKLNNTIHGVATVRAGTEILSFDLTVNMTI